MVIGLTGGVGTGKSTILEYMKQNYDAAVIIADDISRDQMMPGQASYHAVVTRFGDGILSEGPGSPIDRGVLANIVFSDPEKLSELNALTHPFVKQRILELIEQYKKEARKYILVEAALLIQAGYLEFTDELWVVTADHETRASRLEKYRGYSREKTDSIIANQMSDQEMIAYADLVINNSGTPESTWQQIDEYLNSNVPENA